MERSPVTIIDLARVIADYTPPENAHSRRFYSMPSEEDAKDPDIWEAWSVKLQNYKEGINLAIKDYHQSDMLYKKAIGSADEKKYLQAKIADWRRLVIAIRSSDSITNRTDTERDNKR